MAERPMKVEVLCNWCRGRIEFQAPADFSGVHTNCSWCGKRVWLPVDSLRPVEEREHGRAKRL